jgi:hypothetical protein
MENFSPEKRRETLFGLLGHVLVSSKEKFDREKASNDDRLKWGRLIISGVEAYGCLLKDVQLEDWQSESKPWKR